MHMQRTCFLYNYYMGWSLVIKMKIDMSEQETVGIISYLDIFVKTSY